VARTDGRLGRLVRLLSEHATVVMSGTKLADELGLSRSAVWRFVQQLRGLGVDITGHPATGYQLIAISDLLLAEVLGPLVKGTLFYNHVHHYFRIGSTNVAAMAAGAAGEPEGSVFVAEEQTAGRGRGGHTWSSPKSAGIYLSALFRPALAPAQVLPLTLAAGLATADAVEQLTGLRADLRWPNDLVIGERKLAGLLTEMTAEATRVRYLVVGIGLNVNQASFPASIESLATSLRAETGQTWSRVALAAALLKSLDREYRRFIAEGAAQVRERFEARSSFARGRRVQVEENGGYSGTTAGLDEQGFLRVDTANGLRTVLSGGVRAIG